MTSATAEKTRPRRKGPSIIAATVARRLNLKRSYRFGRTISVFIEDNSVQFATVRWFGYLPRLLDTTKVYIPKSFKSEENRRQFIVPEIDRYIREFGRRSTRYILGVGGAGTAFRIITLPKMSRKELDQAVYWEGTKRIPFGLDNSYYGHKLIENMKDSSANKTSVALIAVMKDKIHKYLEYFDSMGIEVNAVCHELEAIGCLLPYIDNFSPDKTYILINIRKGRFEVSFYRGMQLEFMHISSIETEVLSGSSRSPVQSEYFTESLVDQIQNSLDYYVGQSPSTSIETVFIYGDLTYSEELIDNLSARFDIKFSRFPLDDWVELHPHLEPYANQIPVLLSSVALAMADYEMINFLPPEVKEKRSTIKYIRMAVPAFLVFIILLLTFWASLKFQTGIESGRLAATNEQIDRFKTSPTYTMYNQVKSQMAADRAVVARLNQEQTFLHLNLKELSRLTPDKIKLDLYELQTAQLKNNLILQGHAASSEPPPEIVLAEFIARLESSPFFENVSLNRHTKRAKGNAFVIDFQIEMEARI